MGLIFASLTAGYFIYRFVWLVSPPAFPMKFEHSTLASFAFYVRALAVPYPPCLEHTLPSGLQWPVWLIVFAAAVWLLRKSRESLFALAWIVASLLPVLHFISFSNVSPIADRYLYLPAAGLCLLLAHRLGKHDRGELVLASLLAVWTGLTVSRNLDYRSARALFEQGVVCAPDNPRAHFLVGNIRFQEKDYAGARAAYERVLTLTDSVGARQALFEIDRLEKGR